MKKKITTILSWFFAAAFFLGAGVSCKKITNPLDNMQLLIDYNLIKTTIDVHVTDAASGQLLSKEMSNATTLTIAGRDAEAVVDVLGMTPENNQFAVNRGIANMALSPKLGYTPSETNRISYNIIVSLPGYLTTTQQVNITKTGRTFVNVEVIPLNDTPSGVVAIVEPGAATTLPGGQVAAPATVTMPDGEASLHIPEGVVMRDAQGNTLSGNLNVTVVHFDNTDPAALAAFPGGLTPTVERLDGNTESGMFYSAGFVAIEIMDDQGRQASEFFDGTIALTSVVSPETYNPITQTNIAPGDIVPLWSLDESTGIWTEEGTAVVENNNGVLEFNIELTHLSYYNFDWFLGVMCEVGRPFVFTANQPIEGSFLLKGHVYRLDDNSFINTIMMWVSTLEPVLTSWVPQGVGVKIEWDTENSPFISIAPSSQPTIVDDLCGSAPVNVDLIVNNSTEFTTVTMEVSVFCVDDPDVVIKPSFTANCQNITSGGPVIPVEMVEGIAVVQGIKLGDTYLVWITYDGEEYSTEVVVTQDNYSYLDVEIPADICEEIFGEGN